MNRIYPDSNVFIAQWKSETINRFPIDELARQFFEALFREGKTIVVSDLTLREVLSNRLPKEAMSAEFRREKMEEIAARFKAKNQYLFAEALEEDYSQAHQLARKYRSIGAHFSDMLHIAIAERTNSLIVSGDKALRDVCEREGFTASSLF